MSQMPPDPAPFFQNNDNFLSTKLHVRQGNENLHMNSQCLLKYLDLLIYPHHVNVIDVALHGS